MIDVQNPDKRLKSGRFGNRTKKNPDVRILDSHCMLQKMSVSQTHHRKSKKFTVVDHTTSEQKGKSSPIKLVLRRHTRVEVRHHTILLRNTTNSTLQPLHHQPTSLTYGGAQAMDVIGQDRHETLVRVRPPRG